jgi:hypothetical protein
MACSGSRGANPEVGAVVGAAGPRTDLALSWTRPSTDCVGNGGWTLADGFELARKVDYIADREGGTVVSSRGMPCAAGVDPTGCEAQLETIEPSDARNLQTTDHDAVQRWDTGSATGVLGPIDTVEEAIWLVLASGYTVDCDAKLIKSGDVYQLTARQDTRCGPSWIGVTAVDRQGVVREIDGTAHYTPECGIE